MTRKAALLRACELLHTSDCPPGEREELAALRAKLLEIAAELPLASWSEATIFDAIDSWVEEHGRAPTTRELAGKGLPPVPVLKHRFGMTGKEFLDHYYPRRKSRCNSQRYGGKTAGEWKRAFQAEYLRVGPCTASGYNRLRGPGLPTWGTTARILGLRRWSELLQACGAAPKGEPGARRRRSNGPLTVSREVDVDRVLAACGK